MIPVSTNQIKVVVLSEVEVVEALVMVKDVAPVVLSEAAGGCLIGPSASTSFSASCCQGYRDE